MKVPFFSSAHKDTGGKTIHANANEAYRFNAQCGKRHKTSTPVNETGK